MRVRALSILLLLLSLFSLPAHAAEPIKVGLVVSASGPAAFLGEPEKNTAVMLVDAINAKGGVLGRPIELVIYDDETDVNKCVLAVDKLLKKDKVVAVVGPTTSGNTLAVMPKFEPAKVPLISMSAAEKITSPVNPWVFKVAPSDRHAVERILQDAQAKGMKKIAIITVSDGFGQAGREVLLQLLPQKGFELVADEVFGPKDTDMTAQLTAIKDKAPDAIICWGTNPGPAVVARNRQQLGIAIPLYMSHGVASKKFIELSGDAAEGIYLPAGRLAVAAQIADTHPQKQVLTTYIADYEAQYKMPVSSFGGYAYDGLMLIVEAIKMGNSAEPQAIRDNLEKISGFVGTGGIFTMTAEDHNGLTADAFEMVRIEQGDWKIVQ
ncbi:ABC transporter substrate-binding protein [Megalodesulfovibrio gigas]|uniref:Putative ABC transporter substrate binding protein n=1 Tax=Megalodesulfovibrio gigas (strain ATCC 19364 / DSM 1382 / NCIMB 9332 / VKM B-1759) TaxID=1121448 RepID=T2GEX9_MEGG1|nr:ABC transporter substrate-binding protein [Megalodesulfovibrio gigas]AGW14848.1 putative ABC transporter substrate binding protein precursor [Megalodesulfovibrio gigas DSM 1382 = ATCC 19364]